MRSREVQWRRRPGYYNGERRESTHSSRYGDLMGDGVDIAARLEGVCEPGGICLSEDAYRQVRDKLKREFVDLGEKQLTNIARPVRAYALTAAAIATSADQQPSTRSASARGGRMR